MPIQLLQRRRQERPFPTSSLQTGHRLPCVPRLAVVHRLLPQSCHLLSIHDQLLPLRKLFHSLLLFSCLRRRYRFLRMLKLHIQLGLLEVIEVRLGCFVWSAVELHSLTPLYVALEDFGVGHVHVI